MKKVLLAAALFISASSFAGYYNFNANSVVEAKGTHIPASQVPVAVRTTFASMFPDATNVRWQLETEHGKNVYQADFLLNGARWRAVFNADGTLIKAGAR
ncbi:MAG TPA: hypothetical protein PKM63_03860 [Panacibacter sp.]|nr:hypothetical protein [Panacibacter sp.]HNP43393.1 hypothetical protein [Panacibacter sp.]